MTRVVDIVEHSFDSGIESRESYIIQERVTQLVDLEAIAGSEYPELLRRASCT